MQVSVENIGNLERRITVALPPEALDNAVKKRLSELSRTLRIEGFRPGKAPVNIVEQRYGASVRGEVIEKLLQNSLNDALIQEKLDPVNMPTIHHIKADQGQPLEYTATFEVFPEVKLQGLSDLVLEKTNVTITPPDVDRVLEQMRLQHATWEEVQRAASMNDKVILDLNWMDNEASPPKPREQHNVAVVLEEKIMTDDIKSLIGAKAGDSVNIGLHMQGAPGKPTIPALAKVKQVMVAKLPNLDDEFAKYLDVKGGLTELRAEVQKHMELQLQANLKAKLRNQVIEKLLERHNLELPPKLVDAEIAHLEQETRAQLAQQGKQQEATAAWSEQTRANTVAMARRRVTLSIIYRVLMKEYDLKADVKRIRERVEQAASMFEDPNHMVTEIYKEPAMMQNIRSQVLEEQIIDKLLEQVKYTEKTADYAQVMQIGAQKGE